VHAILAQVVRGGRHESATELARVAELAFDLEGIAMNDARELAVRLAQPAPNLSFQALALSRAGVRVECKRSVEARPSFSLGPDRSNDRLAGFGNEALALEDVA
jgi:hypothetical protein